MSSTFAGYPIETKPGKPRLDIKPGTSGDIPQEWNFQYKLYSDVSFVGDFNMAIAIGDNVDLSKPQTIHSALNYLRDFLFENLRSIPRNPIVRSGVVLSMDQHAIKSQIVITDAGVGSIQEGDLDQDGVNLVFFINSEDAPSPFQHGPGPFRTSITRLIELAREKGYYTIGEVRRGSTEVPDQSVAEGATATFTPPSWNDGPDGVGPSPTNLVWLENGILMRPFQPGLQNLVLTNVTLDMDGNVYQVRAYASDGPSDIGDAYRHSNIGTLTVT